MSRKSAWMGKNRRRARAAGLCGTCCTRQPAVGRSVCERCKEAARRRTVKLRATERQRREQQTIVAAYEREGDAARSHQLYADAVEYYKKAISSPSLTPADRLRVSEKLVYAQFHGGDPEAADRELDHLLAEHFVTSADVLKFAELLLQ